MGALGRFEDRLGSLVEGAFAKVFKGQVEPVEIAGALAERAQHSATIVSADKTLVHNHYRVELGASDAERLLPYAGDLQEELATILREHAQEKNWSFPGPVRVVLARADGLSTGVFRLDSEVRQAAPLHRRPVGGVAPDGTEQPRESPARSGAATSTGARPAGAPAQYDDDPISAPISGLVPTTGAPDGAAAAGAAAAGAGGVFTSADWAAPADPNGDSSDDAPAPAVAAQPVHLDPAPTMGAAPRLVVGGEAAQSRHGADVELVSTVTTLGRGADNDVQLVDGGISRRHAEIRVEADGVHVVDVGSTNGTTVNGRAVQRSLLHDGDTVLLGRTTLTFRLPRDA